MAAKHALFTMTGSASTGTPSNVGSLASSFASSVASSCTGFGSVALGGGSDFGGIDLPQPKTTIILRNIPNGYCRSQLLELLDSHGFNSLYDFVYVPVDFSTRVGFGYAFVNFLDQISAERCTAELTGFNDWVFSSDKVLEVTWSTSRQGLQSHIDRYRNSPVMHDSVADELKPAIFLKGERIIFPHPTKTVKMPRQRREH